MVLQTILQDRYAGNNKCVYCTRTIQQKKFRISYQTSHDKHQTTPEARKQRSIHHDTLNILRSEKHFNPMLFISFSLSSPNQTDGNLVRRTYKPWNTSTVKGTFNRCCAPVHTKSMKAVLSVPKRKRPQNEIISNTLPLQLIRKGFEKVNKYKPLL